MVLLCWPWQHYSHGDGASIVLGNVAFVMVFAVVSRFPGVVLEVGSCLGTSFT
jgi:hypothetical protein